MRKTHIKQVYVLLVAAFCLFGGSAIALPQPSCVPEWPNPFTVRDQSVKVEISNHIARTTVYQEIVNTLDMDIPCNIDYKVPAGAHASAFSAVVDGKTYNAVVKSREVARATVEEAKKQKKVAALAEERSNGILHIELSQVKAQSVFQFQISYIQETSYSKGVFSYDFGVPTENKELGKPGSFNVSVEFDCSVDISEVTSETNNLEGSLSGRKGQFKVLDANAGLPFSISYKLAMEPGVPYMLLKDDAEKDDPYFSLLMLPPTEEKITSGRSVVFVLDKSGSMKDENRYAMAVKALEKFIDRLTVMDKVNVVIFDVETFTCSDTLIPCNQAGKDKVKKFINSFEPVNGTRFLKPLVDVSEMLKKEKTTMPSIVLLTDGEDNEDSAATFVTALRKNDSFKIPMFTFAIGSSVNMALLRSLAAYSGAEFGHISRSNEIDPTLEVVADKFERIIGRNLACSAEADSAYSIFPAKLANLYSGELIIAYGRVKNSTAVNLMVNAQTETGDWNKSITIDTTGDKTTCSFLGQQWASRKMRELLDEITVFGAKKELVDQVKEVSEKFLLSSPYTSLIFSEIAFQEPEEIDEVVEMEKKLEGQGGYRGRRRNKSSSKKAPNSPVEDSIAEEREDAEDTPADKEAQSQRDAEEKARLEESYKRIEVDRLKMAKAMGGDEKTEASINKAFVWLAKTQGADGSWKSSQTGGEAGHDIEITALAVLALSGGLNSPYQGRYRETSRKALAWLAKQQTKDGNFAPNEGIRVHALVLYAFSDCCSRFNLYDYRKNISKGLGWLLSAQNVFSAWGFKKGDKINDVITTTYALRAIVAAKFIGHSIADIRLIAAGSFLKKAAMVNEGRTPNFAVLDKEHSSNVLAPFFASSYAFMQDTVASPIYTAAFSVTSSTLPKYEMALPKDVQLSWFFATDLLRAVPGKDNANYSVWMKELVPTLFNLQAVDGDNAGSWGSIGEKGIVASLGRVASTALCAMMLESFYRPEDLVRLMKP